MIRAVLFDLDGTLLDTAPDLVGALNHLRVAEGLEPVSIQEYRHHVSRGALGLITAGMPQSSAEIYETRKALFLDHYERNIFVNTKLFDGVDGLLSGLAERAIPWGIVTNKMEYLTFPLLKAAGLSSKAACVICGDTLRQSKPHPAPVSLGCEIMGISEVETLMVGDDLRDLQAGRAAGTLTAFASYGYVERGLTEQNMLGSYIVQRPGDVLEILKAAESIL